MTPSSHTTSSSVTETFSVRALVVDDDPLTRRLMERMLQVRSSPFVSRAH